MALTVSEYTVVEEGVAIGFCRLEVNPSDPDQDQLVASLELALNLTVSPLQIGPLLIIPEEDGIGLTVTMVIYTVAGEQPLPILLTVRE
jgi:hypothetical protein